MVLRDGVIMDGLFAIIRSISYLTLTGYPHSTPSQPSHHHHKTIIKPSKLSNHKLIVSQRFGGICDGLMVLWKKNGYGTDCTIIMIPYKGGIW